jgi:hypothetical protein
LERPTRRRIQPAEQHNIERVPVDAPAASVPDDFAEHSQLMFDLVTLRPARAGLS